MKFTSAAIALPFILASQVTAICPGSNFGIGNVQHLGGATNRWSVYDDTCNQVDGLTTSKDPCTEGIFGCTPPPVTFNRYTSTFTGLIYNCRPDPNAGVCGSDPISVCCSNN
ncbi:hypothetical protein NP233_g12509 [Leucocoprinus birnbaumii]|uniref:Uncharacterized protein n=1 Tax=Leucocoprinus birnbaumii TaxID=56174 RepID=A0AAD5VFJ5_9AGAR|nr:hypothetical protein NP233_g12509 [Leucocoprinus birnbaumii]